MISKFEDDEGQSSDAERAAVTVASMRIAFVRQPDSTTGPDWYEWAAGYGWTAEHYQRALQRLGDSMGGPLEPLP